MTIKLSTIKDLQPAVYNPRQIAPDQLEALGKSMCEFGDLSGIVVNKRTGTMISGHQRIKHLQPEWKIVAQPHKDSVGTVALGYVTTPHGRIAYREVDWPLKKEKLANIAANKHGGQFDIPKLKDILVELDDGQCDLILSGFNEAELKKLIDWEGEQGQTDADNVPEPPKKAITKSGDLWILGEHRLLCGDATKKEDVEKLMGGEKTNMVFIDPPYGVNYGHDQEELQKMSGVKFSKTRKKHKIEGDDLSAKETSEKLWRPAFRNLYEFSKDDCSFYMTMCQGGDQMMMMMMMMSEHWQIKHELIWVKNAPVFSMGRLDYDYQHEPILFGWKKKHNFYGGGQFVKSVWQINKPSKSELHPTMKPVELMENAILNSSKKEDVVIDTFGGSGSTLIACEKLNRKCRMMEIDPIYCDVIVKRWENFTGGKAVLCQK